MIYSVLVAQTYEEIPKTYPSLQMSYVIHKISMSTAVFCIVDKAFKLTRFGVKVNKVEPNSSDVFD